MEFCHGLTRRNIFANLLFLLKKNGGGFTTYKLYNILLLLFGGYEDMLEYERYMRALGFKRLRELVDKMLAGSLGSENFQEFKNLDGWERDYAMQTLKGQIWELNETKRILEKNIEDIKDKIESYENCRDTMKYWSDLKNEEE
jgi:hypothetical protein